MGIFEDIQRARAAIEEQGLQPTVYVVSPLQYEREVERELGIIRKPLPVTENRAMRRARRG